MLRYATLEDYRLAVGDPTAELTDVQLSAASQAVRNFTRSAVYATDADGYPADAAVREAFRLATVAQLQALHAADAKAAAEAASPLAGLSEASIDGVTWKAGGGSNVLGTAALYSIPAPGALCVAAIDYLLDIPREVWVYG